MSKEDTQKETKKMVGVINKFLDKNDLLPAHIQCLSTIADKLMLLQNHVAIIETLLKKRSYDVRVKYFQLIMPIQKELGEKIKNLLKSLEIFSVSKKASYGMKSKELGELGKNCTESAKQKLSLLELFIKKIEKTRNELTKENDDGTWLQILTDELDDFIGNISYYE